MYRSKCCRWRRILRRGREIVIEGSIERVLARFDGVTRTGAGWRVRCPVHSDEYPSLDIKVAESGAVLFSCRSKRCGFDDIVRAARLEGVTLGNSLQQRAGDPS